MEVERLRTRKGKARDEILMWTCHVLHIGFGQFTLVLSTYFPSTGSPKSVLFGVLVRWSVFHPDDLGSIPDEGNVKSSEKCKANFNVDMPCSSHWIWPIYISTINIFSQHRVTNKSSNFVYLLVGQLPCIAKVQTSYAGYTMAQ